MIRACVIGWPISHSRSPLIHRYWLKAFGIDGSYSRVPVEPENLAQFISDLVKNGFAGCNVTLPHKENVFRIVTPADEATRRLGAVNTVFIRDGQTFGTNTDVEGFLNSLRQSRPELDLKNKRAVVLGAGGAAMSVVEALLRENVTEITVCNRSIEKAQGLRNRFGPAIKPEVWERRSAVLKDCSLLVNTTSLGMKGQDQLEIDLEPLDRSAIVTDIVYVPLRTRLLDDAAKQGNPVVEGLGMLLHQAVRGFELWFGKRPQVTQDLYNLVACDIDPDYRS